MAWLQTCSGGIFDYADLRKSDVRLSDIAHSLGNICRFNGHVKKFYSVAEHCYFVSNMVSIGLRDLGLQNEIQNIRKWALMHDAAEAYIGDMPSPLKRIMPEFAAAEEKILQVIGDKLGLPDYASFKEKYWKFIKIADSRMLSTEAPLVHNWPPPKPWFGLLDPYDGLELNYWAPEEATKAFLQQAALLGIL